MSWYSKAWDTTKGYTSKGYHGTLGLSANHHWGWSVGAGSLGGIAIGAGIGYGVDEGSGSAWGAGIGALGGAGLGLGAKTIGNDLIRGRYLAKTGMAATNPRSYGKLGAKYRGGFWKGLQENWG